MFMDRQAFAFPDSSCMNSDYPGRHAGKAGGSSNIPHPDYSPNDGNGQPIRAETAPALEI
jgi:hypothetical protein